MPMDHIHWSRPGQFYSLGISYPPERLIMQASQSPVQHECQPLTPHNIAPQLGAPHVLLVGLHLSYAVILIPWCWFLGPNMMQRFILQIKHPVNSTWLDLYSLFCREFQGVLLHPLRFCARPHASVTADSNNQCCLGRFQQFFFYHDFCPKWEELKNLLFRAILGTEAVIQ